MKVLDVVGNAAVVQLEGRKFPAIAVQGDTMSILLGDLQAALKGLRAGDLPEAEAELASAVSRVQSYLQIYEGSLSKHGLKLPYFKSMGEG